LFQTNLVGGVVPPIHFNEWGGTLAVPSGSPRFITARRRPSSFVAFDNTHNQDPRPGSNRSVPTALERTGDFSQSFTTSAGQRFPIQVFDPLSVNAATGNRTLFPGSVIPKNQLDPISQKILDFVPLPNTAGDPTSNASNNFISSATRQDTFPVLSVRGDQNWNNSHHSFATVRWAHLDETLDNYFHNVATGNYHVRVAENIGVDHVWTLRPEQSARFALQRESL